MIARFRISLLTRFSKPIQTNLPRVSLRPHQDAGRPRSCNRCNYYKDTEYCNLNSIILDSSLRKFVAAGSLAQDNPAITNRGSGSEMCRSIKVLRTPNGQPTDAVVREAALQFVRKISGYRHPSQANLAVFESAVDDIAATSHILLASLRQRSPAGVNH